MNPFYRLNAWLDRPKVRALFWCFVIADAITIVLDVIFASIALITNVIAFCLFLSVVGCCVLRMKLGQPEVRGE